MTYTVRIRGASGLIAQEYYCDPCASRFTETIERPAPTSFACPRCGEMAEAVISAPRVKAQLVTFKTGKSQEMPSPLAMNTEPLADGEPYYKWREKRDAVFDEARRKRIKEKLG